MPSASAALAANEQGKFWEFHDRLFAEKKLSKQVINKIAVDLKLDIPRFEKDLKSQKIKNQIQKDIQAGKKAGVTGTPTVFINGRIPRQRTPEGFQAVINDELSKLGKKQDTL